MAATFGNSTVVTVFGGSGFLGRYVVQALARSGCRIKAAVRRPELALHLQPLGTVGQIALLQANVRDEKSVVEAVRGADWRPSVCFSGRSSWRRADSSKESCTATDPRDIV